MNLIGRTALVSGGPGSIKEVFIQIVNTGWEGAELTSSEQEVVAKEGVGICCVQDLLLKVNISKLISKVFLSLQDQAVMGGMAFIDLR